MNEDLPPYYELKNEVGTEFNQFNIIRGRQFIKMGIDVWIGYFCFIDGSGGLEIGDHVSFSSGVHIYTHDTSRFRQFGGEKNMQTGVHCDRAPVKIGSHVQIGANSIVLKGVTIGNHVIVGALSLVNQDIPDYSVAVGSPARIIRKINPNDCI